jgi:hypothetical protein
LARTNLRLKCSATVKSTGERCKKWAVEGYRVCGSHGAGSPHKGRPGGFNKIMTKAGRTSRYASYLPGDLAERMNKIYLDPELLSFRDDISLLDLRISQLLDMIANGNFMGDWETLLGCYKSMRKNLEKGGNPEKFDEAFERMGEIFGSTDTDVHTWNQIVTILAERRKFAESEAKRMIQAESMLRLDEVNRLMGALASAVKEYVTDTDVLEKINREFVRISTIPNKPGVASDREDR